MSHYFDLDPNLASNKKTIEFEIYGKKIQLLTDNGVFSKNRIDEGSYAFLKVLLPLGLSGKVLDLGCGYGPIGLTMAISNPNVSVTLADVNPRALALCEENAKLLGLSPRVTCLLSDIYENIEGQYDAIVVNPPIRAGKKVTWSMYEGALQHLTQGGSLYVVIRKAQGGPSASEHIREIFGNIELLKKDKGYYMYHARKN